MPKRNTPKFCPNCGHPLSMGTIFCPNCGYKIKSSVSNNIQTSRINNRYHSKNRHNYKKLWWIIIIVIALIIGGAFYGEHNHNTPNNSTESSRRSGSSYHPTSTKESNVAYTINNFWGGPGLGSGINGCTVNVNFIKTLFIGGFSNPDCKNSLIWLNAVQTHLKINYIKAHIKNIHISGKYAYSTVQVDYEFQSKSSHKKELIKQGFIWHCKLKQSSNPNVIPVTHYQYIYNKADNKHPVYSHVVKD